MYWKVLNQILIVLIQIEKQKTSSFLYSSLYLRSGKLLRFDILCLIWLLPGFFAWSSISPWPGSSLSFQLKFFPLDFTVQAIADCLRLAVFLSNLTLPCPCSAVTSAWNKSLTLSFHSRFPCSRNMY